MFVCKARHLVLAGGSKVRMSGLYKWQDWLVRNFGTGYFCQVLGEGRRFLWDFELPSCHLSLSFVRYMWDTRQPGGPSKEVKVSTLLELRQGYKGKCEVAAGFLFRTSFSECLSFWK